MVEMEFGEVFEGETEFACKLEVLFTVYTRFPLTGLMDEKAFGSRPKNTPDAKYELEFSTSIAAQLLNTN
jgi:hypothetical protein